jgi:hypothetical protein
MARVQVAFMDVDQDGDREVVVTNPWLRAVIRIPERLGEVRYGRRWSWGGRLQSLVYRPTGREFFMTAMIDPENNRPFGLPDELFASFPMAPDNGNPRWLKMGVGVFTKQGDQTRLDPLPWTWFTERHGTETAVVFRQEASGLDGYHFVYDKRYRFRPDAAWFAMDVVWKNGGPQPLASDWDIHSFHVSGAPPRASWLVAPKRAWVTCGTARFRAILKEPSPIFATSDPTEMVADRILWDLDGPGWWYALGPGDGDEFYLLRGRFEPYRGLFWHGWQAFTPQGINHVEVPAGDTAVWGFDVTLGAGGRHFVRAGEDCGMTVHRPENGRTAVVGVHAASRRRGRLRVHLLDQTGKKRQTEKKAGILRPGDPLTVTLTLPADGGLVTLEAAYEEKGRVVLHAAEPVPVAPCRPTAVLPFDGAGIPVYVAVDPALDHAEADGRYLHDHGVQCGFAVAWQGPGVQHPPVFPDCRVLCIVGDAWPPDRSGELRRWVEAGGGLLLCAPFGKLAQALGDLVPLRPVHDGTLQRADPVLSLQAGMPHTTADRLMLHPDANVRIGLWTPATARPGAVVTLRFTDADRHPAVAVASAGNGRIAAIASRVAWGSGYRSAVWDGWGQYHRACFGGLMGWLAGRWR